MRLVARHAEIGYLSPKDRTGCRNCRYLTDAQPENGIGLPPRPYCSRYSVEVTSGGICTSFHSIPSPTRGTPHQVNQLDLLDLVPGVLASLQFFNMGKSSFGQVNA